MMLCRSLWFSRFLGDRRENKRLPRPPPKKKHNTVVVPQIHPTYHRQETALSMGFMHALTVKEGLRLIDVPNVPSHVIVHENGAFVLSHDDESTPLVTTRPQAQRQVVTAPIPAVEAYDERPLLSPSSVRAREQTDGTLSVGSSSSENHADVDGFELVTVSMASECDVSPPSEGCCIA